MKIIKKIMLTTAGVATLIMGGILAAPQAYAVTANVCGTSGPRCATFVQTYINPFLALLSGLVGVLAVISLVMAGIQYSASADDPGAVSKAKERIFNTIIGLLAYIFLYAFLDYLIPGGILK